MSARDIALKVEADDIADAIGYVLDRPYGRAFVWGILEQCRVFGASFTGEPLTTAFNEGKRHIGIKLLADVLQAKPDAMAQMQNEHAERQKRYLVTSTDEEGDDL